MGIFGEVEGYLYRPHRSNSGFRVSGIFDSAHRTEPYGSGVVVHDGTNSADITRPAVFLRLSEFNGRKEPDIDDEITIENRRYRVVELIDGGRAEVLAILMEADDDRASKFARSNN